MSTSTVLKFFRLVGEFSAFPPQKYYSLRMEGNISSILKKTNSEFTSGTEVVIFTKATLEITGSVALVVPTLHSSVLRLPSGCDISRRSGTRDFRVS